MVSWRLRLMLTSVLSRIDPLRSFSTIRTGPTRILRHQNPPSPCCRITSRRSLHLKSSSGSTDTIYALSSGLIGGQATALAIIRMSGPECDSTLSQLTKVPLPNPRVASLRTLFDHQGHLLDSALVIRFPGPGSFTGEDIVELHCHGSRAVVQGVLETLSAHNLRLAEPGEFSQRAFSNGKLSLLETEALADLLVAETATQRKQALSSTSGMTEHYENWRNQLIAGLAHAEAVIDFGDDEMLDDTVDSKEEASLQVWGNVRTQMQELSKSMTRRSSQRAGEWVRVGVPICILGPPNSGKSSLFNCLSQHDAAIVSPTAGTTRDVLQVSLDLGGVKCLLFDTAGLRSETLDDIEKIGMERAWKTATEAKIVIVMIDGSSEHSEEWQATLDKVRSDGDVDVFIVRNKMDLGLSDAASQVQVDGVKELFDVSCTTEDGIDLLLGNLTSHVQQIIQEDSEDGEGVLVTRTRHRQHIQAAVEALERFDTMSSQGHAAVDMAAEELRLAASEIGRVTGAVDVEDVLDKLFQDFCIGK